MFYEHLLYISRWPIFWGDFEKTNKKKKKKVKILNLLKPLFTLEYVFNSLK